MTPTRSRPKRFQCRSRNESSLIDLDKVMELLRKQTQVKISECKELKAQEAKIKKNCYEDLIDFQEKAIDRLYDIRKEYLIKHHSRVLEELDQTRIKHRETVKQAFQQP